MAMRISQLASYGRRPGKKTISRTIERLDARQALLPSFELPQDLAQVCNHERPFSIGLMRVGRCPSTCDAVANMFRGISLEDWRQISEDGIVVFCFIDDRARLG